jgi:hypothetical protein
MTLEEELQSSPILRASNSKKEMETPKALSVSELTPFNLILDPVWVFDLMGVCKGKIAGV